MHLHALDYVLWVAAPCLQGGILFFMHRRRLVGRLPFFFAYTILQVATDIYLLAIERFSSYRIYFYSYWAFTALLVIFTFAIILELFRASFRNFGAIRNVGTSIFRWSALLLVVAAALTLFVLHHEGQSARATETILIADRSARAMLCLLAVLVLLGARHLRLSRRTIVYGIALGFAVYMLAKVALDSVALLHPNFLATINRVNGVAYISASVLWLAYVICGDTLPRPVAAWGPTDVLVEGRNVLDVINRIVEESMRNAQKTT